MVLGGLTVGFGLGGIGLILAAALPQPGRAAAVALLVAVIVAIGNSNYRARLPQRRRLVPQSVLSAGDVAGPLRFGVEMGLGFMTYSMSPLPLTLAITAVFIPAELAGGLLAGAGFALGRALVPPLRSRDPDRWENQISARRGWFDAILTVGFVAILVGSATGVVSPLFR